MRIEVVVRGAVRLEIVETAGTVAYAMRGASSRWDVDLTLSEGASLTWHGEPFVISEGANVTRSLHARLEPGCTAMLRESLVLGRHGESGGRLRTTTRVWLGAEVLLAEDLCPDDGWAVLGDSRCLDTITALGMRLPDQAATLQLDGPASIARSLTGAQHLSDLGAVWRTAQERQVGAMVRR